MKFYSVSWIHIDKGDQRVWFSNMRDLPRIKREAREDMKDYLESGYGPKRGLEDHDFTVKKHSLTLQKGSIIRMLNAYAGGD